MVCGDPASGSSSLSATFSNEIGGVFGWTENPSPVTIDGTGSEFVLVESTSTGVGRLDKVEVDLPAWGNGVDLKGMGWLFH